MVNVKDECDGDILWINFWVFCEWRGKVVRVVMVDFFILLLKIVGRIDLVNVVFEVYKNGCGLLKLDFDWFVDEFVDWFKILLNMKLFVIFLYFIDIWFVFM